MARSFNGTSDNIQVQSIDLTGHPQLTVSFWLNWTTFANDDKLACEFTSNYATHAGGFICDPDSSNPSAGSAYFGANGGGGFTTAEFARPSSGTWHNWIVLFDGTSSGANAIPTVYIDGVSQSLTHSNTGFNGAGFTGFANDKLNLMCRNAASLFGAGSMADYAIWSVLLTQGEATALAKGARPYQIRPPVSLQHWEPIDGLQSPEPDLSSHANNGTVTGTALAPGPPVMMFTPRWPMGAILPVGAGGVTTVYRSTLSALGTRTGSRQVQL